MEDEDSDFDLKKGKVSAAKKKVSQPDFAHLESVGEAIVLTTLFELAYDELPMKGKFKVTGDENSGVIKTKVPVEDVIKMALRSLRVVDENMFGEDNEKYYSDFHFMLATNFAAVNPDGSFDRYSHITTVYEDNEFVLKIRDSSIVPNYTSSGKLRPKK